MPVSPFLERDTTWFSGPFSRRRLTTLTDFVFSGFFEHFSTVATDQGQVGHVV
jgi:hypothetical protein